MAKAPAWDAALKRTGHNDCIPAMQPTRKTCQFVGVIMKEILVKCEYDAKLKAYRPAILRSVMTFTTKKEAAEFASAIGWPKNSVEAVGSRLGGRVCGLTSGFGMFLFDPHYTPNPAYWQRPSPTAAEMRSVIDMYAKM